MSASTTTVLVTGVRGKTGREVAAQLADRAGIAVRGASSDPSRVDLAGVDPVAFDWGRPDAWPDALADVDAVYLMRPDLEDAPSLVTGVVAAAPPAARIVLLSEMGAERDYPPDGWAPEVERAVTDGAGERPWTILRPNWFHQVLTDERYFRASIADDGVLPMPTGAAAAISYVDTRDIAAVAVEALAAPGHAGRIYTISGPAALDADELARRLSAGIGRPVRAVDPSPEQIAAGLDPWLAELNEDVYRRIRAGGFAEVTDTVERVTGRAARSVDDFIVEHASAWRGAVAQGDRA